MPSYKLLEAGDLPGGISYYLWERDGWLYVTLRRGPIRRTVYMGRLEEAAETPAEPQDDCMRLLKELAEAFEEAVELARRAAREAQTREEMREALKELSYRPRALEEALELLGRE
ncbi:hypothetical protein Pogu_0629 [Pyrobaculum oguniense TE7]|uniref:Uncharacterized protein n=1 Tax=Pyrobaculum oguniense (strain DSM 13380 / JCM 10595 / TE7) TaxID=698757 RepID=H6Q7Z9_PYROT|nr:hypothetical protein Pogu_0629 [Pyrobaculum oguniense TE7]